LNAVKINSNAITKKEIRSLSTLGPSAYSGGIRLTHRRNDMIRRFIEHINTGNAEDPPAEKLRI
jgi:hypothetical protein